MNEEKLSRSKTSIAVSMKFESMKLAKFHRNKVLTKKIGKKMVDRLEDPIYEMHFTSIASKYLRTYFFFEFIACAPILVYEAVYKFTTDYEEVKENHIESTLY